jgi:hypothetical protein
MIMKIYELHMQDKEGNRKSVRVGAVDEANVNFLYHKKYSRDYELDRILKVGTINPAYQVVEFTSIINVAG